MLGSLLGVAWENVLVGLLGGATVSGLAYATRRVRDVRLQKRFPVAGNYITKFDDSVDGRPYVAAAPASLVQKGKRITGSTTMGARTWLLQGELSGLGYLHGIYFAEDPVDKGIGNFFLRIYNDRHMEGIWSGYDSENGTIASGKYVFRPVAGVVVRSLQPEDTVPILAIADDRLGEGYIDQRTIRESVSNEAGFAKVAMLGSRVVGFALCAIHDRDEAASRIRIAPPRHLRSAREIGFLGAVSVESRVEARSVGTTLVRSCLEEFRHRRIPVVYGIAWKTRSGVHAKGILERESFSAIAEVPDYWRAASIAEGFSCPECGPPPCGCTGVVYSRVLQE